MSRTQPDRNSRHDGRYDAFPDIPDRSERGRHGTADDCFEAMRRHHDRQRQGFATHATSAEPIAPVSAAPTTGGSRQAGDIIYGAEAIARFIFDDCDAVEPRKARRRVYHLWNHYRDRKEAAGFLKLKGTLCLSKNQWRKFHGLD